MQLFYTQNINENIAILEVEDAKHCKVLRKNTADKLNIIDGFGNLYVTEILAILKNSVETKIIQKTFFPKNRTYYFHLLIAPTKQNERMEWMLEKCIETGIDEITFLNTEHCEKTRINKERLTKIAISAMKQSGEYYLPKINEVLNFKDFLTFEHPSQHFNLLAHCNYLFEKNTLKQIIEQHKEADNLHINCFIGPEGDFSQNEIDLCYRKGFKGLSLGKTRLRTETAGLYCAMGLSNLL